MKPIPYGRQHITQEDIDAVTAVLQSDFLTTGPKVKEFEEKFAAYVGSKYAVAVANGTAALHLSALALDVNEESKVITTPITFAASANCVRYCNGEIVFADVCQDTILLDINKVHELLEAAPKGTYQGIIPVDFAGYPVNMEAFRNLANEYGLWLLEDACHAPGGWFTDSNGQKQRCGNGNFSDLTIFSFHPVKHIACGEGGMVTTNNEILFNKLLNLRSHGMVYQGNPNLTENHGGWYMEMQGLGYNYRMPDILCTLGISQLQRAEQGLNRRRKIAEMYDCAFSGSAIKTIVPPPTIGHAYHLYVIEVENRKKLYDDLRKEDIYTQVHYIPVHRMPYYENLGFMKGAMPIAETYYERCISLPMFPSMTNDEVEFVIEKVINISGC